MKSVQCFEKGKLLVAGAITLGVVVVCWAFSPTARPVAPGRVSLCAEVGAQQRIIEEVSQDVSEINVHLLQISNQIQKED